MLGLREVYRVGWMREWICMSNWTWRRKIQGLGNRSFCLLVVRFPGCWFFGGGCKAYIGKEVLEVVFHSKRNRLICFHEDLRGDRNRSIYERQGGYMKYTHPTF